MHSLAVFRERIRCSPPAFRQNRLFPSARRGSFQLESAEWGCRPRRDCGASPSWPACVGTQRARPAGYYW
eukprot:1325170-Rhodomonas_salina.1